MTAGTEVATLLHERTHGNVEIDFDSRRVTMEGVPVDLRAMEYDLLAFFASHPHQLFSRSELLELVWHSDSDWQQESTVTEHVYRVRAKITGRGDRNTINTIRGGGYRYDPPTRDDVAAVHRSETIRNNVPLPVIDQISRARGECVVLTTLRALLRIDSAEDAAALLQHSVRQLGGTMLAAHQPGPDALPIDVTLGTGAPMFAIAEPDTVAKLLLESLLPGLAEDALHALSLLRRQPQDERTLFTTPASCVLPRPLL